jgi:hypothetical protein
MIGTNKIAILGSLLIMGMAVLPAHATLSNTEFLIIDAAHPSGVTLTCSSVGANCTSDNEFFFIAYQDADFNVLITATGNAPDGPASITFDTEAQSKGGSVMTPNNLTVAMSMIGFTSPSGPGLLDASDTQNANPKTSNTGSSSVQGFLGPNAFFCETTSTCTAQSPLVSFATLNSASSPNTATGTHFTPAFSLTDVIKESFTTKTANGSYSLTDSVLSATSTAVPEPASVVLLGTVLLLAVFLIRRKTQKA